MNEIILSIIIPVYNAEKYLAQCLKSILDYPGEKVEVILVDDGSTDNSAQIAHSFPDRRVAVYSQENQGPGAARNRGIRLSRGKYLMFVDSDDWLEPGSMGKIISLLSGTVEITLLFDSIVWKSDMQKVIRRLPLPDDYCYNSEEQKAELIKQSLITFDLNSPVDKVYSGKVIRNNQIRFPLIRYGEDSIFNLSYFSKSKRGRYIDASFYNYRYNPASLTNKYDSGIFANLAALYQYRLHFSAEYFHDTAVSSGEEMIRQISDGCLKNLSSCVVNAKYCHITNSEIQAEVNRIPVFRELLHAPAISVKTRLQQFLIRLGLYDLLLFLHDVYQFRIPGKRR